MMILLIFSNSRKEGLWTIGVCLLMRRKLFLSEIAGRFLWKESGFIVTQAKLIITISEIMLYLLQYE